MSEPIEEKIKKIATPCEGGFLLKIKVVANSKQNSFEFTPESIQPFKLKISKPAVDGKANEEIIKYVAKILNLSKNKVSLTKGEKSSIKTLLLKL